MKQISVLINFLLICMFLISMCTALTCAPQDNLQAKVIQAVDLPFPQQAENTRRQLTALGAPAIPFIVDVIRSNTSLNPVKKIFLIGIVANMKGEQSTTALVNFLSDSDPHVRGVAASYLGTRKFKAAVPYLVNLLGDKEVYKTTVQTDPAAEQNVLVRDVAIEALQAINGIALAQRGSKEDQVKAWLRWWRKQPTLKRSC